MASKTPKSNSTNTQLPVNCQSTRGPGTTESKDCLVCQETIKRRTPTITHSGGRAVCKGCFEDWLGHNHDDKVIHCMVCRADISFSLTNLLGPELLQHINKTAPKPEESHISVRDPRVDAALTFRDAADVARLKRAMKKVSTPETLWMVDTFDYVLAVLLAGFAPYRRLRIATDLSQQARLACEPSTQGISRAIQRRPEIERGSFPTRVR